MDSRKGAGDDYVTIVSVGNPEGKHVAAEDAAVHVTDVPFVTVLSIGQRPPEEEVTIYRLPGEKLGFGLKFEGGTKSSECVRRLFIQSCAPDSPAGRARAAWGPLQPGDEILQIDNLSITNLTRLECVRSLKDSNVAVSLLVRHDDVECALEAEIKLSEDTANGVSKVRVEPSPIKKQEEDKASLPPPVPPRKLNRKSALNSVNQIEVNKTAESVSNGNATNSNKGAVGKQSPGRPRHLPPAPHTSPAEAQVYTDLFCQEKEKELGILVAESESDDTGSSISTVIDRLSVYSSFPGSVENSIPSTPTLGYKQLNLNNVFNCLDNITLLSDIPPSIVEENIKILSKSSNASTPPEKATGVGDAKASTTIIKRDEQTSIVTVSTTNNKDFESSSREKLCANVFPKGSQNSDNNNNYSQKSDTIIKDTNNINVQVISKQDDVVDCPVVFNKKVAEKKSTMEPPKPKPRNMNKKHGTENTFSGRQFDDNLSLTKLHCIESWLQDSISCKNSEEPSYTREDDVPAVRPEALPRLIDFVPKTHVFKSQAEITETKEKLSPSSLKTIDSDISEENANHLRLIITRDPCQDWCNSNASPQLETIYENFSTCPTLLVDETSRHPPAGDSGSDQGTLVSVEQNKGSDLSTPELRERNGGGNKGLDVSHGRQDSEECGGESRGPRPPPDGRENPLVHHEDLPPPPPLALFLREPPKTTSLTLLPKTTTANPKDTKRYEHGIRSPPDSPIRLIKTSDKSYGGRGKDVKSEGSVKDKIAMFSVSKTTPKEPPVFNHQTSYNSLDKRVNSNSRVTDIVPDYTPPARKYSLPSEPMVKTYEIKEWLAMPKTVDAIERPDPLRDYPRYTKPQVKEVEPKISPIVLLNLALAANPAKTDIEKKLSHKTTLDQLIEQRKKSMNKLRGLVIPESQSLTNLPEIKSRDSLKISSSPNIGAARNEKTKPTEPSRMTVSSSLTSLWDNSAIINNVPKYSPAFKRKSLQVYGPKSSNTLDTLKYTDNLDSNTNKSLDSKGPVPIKPPRTSLDMKRPYDHREFSDRNQTLPPPFKAPAIPNPLNIHLSPQVQKSKGPELQYNDAVDSPTFKTPKHFPEAADSDDSSYLSTVSSPTPSLNTVDNTESDCSSQCMLSQKYQHFSKNDGVFDYGLHNPAYQPDNEKTNVCRSLSSDTSHSAGSSNSSTLTSGSQASCSSAGSSDNGSHRVLKPRSIEAINRKNILASAKCRSGKDNKFGSPLIERKFSDVESTDDDVTQKHTESQYTKPRSDGGLANSILKVAYSTLVVEDKCPETDSTYSDTESDCDFGSVPPPKAELPPSKPNYTNGSSLISRKTNEVNYTRRSSDTYTKPPLDQVNIKRVSENGESKNNNIEIARSVKTNANFEESIAVFPVESKKCEYESLDASSCGVSEDEQENWCEVILSRGASGGVGVTLAGGADCEAQQVTIHKVLLGSAAERDGRLRKGDRVISINGHTMKGVTHSQSVAILKEQLPEVSIVVCGKRTAENSSAATIEDSPSSAVVSVVLEKTDDLGAGLGMSLQGGGSRPLLINKLFTGGAAANSGSITSGSELLSVGGSPLTGLTRTQAWTLIRALPIGPFTLELRPQ